MSMGKVDMSLDDIIKTNIGSISKKKKNKNQFRQNQCQNQGQRRRYGQNRGQHHGQRRGYGPSQGQNKGQIQGRPFANSSRASNRLLISNLGDQVTESDIRELFQDFGTIVKLALHHNSQGESLGTAEVSFDSIESGVKAQREYRGVALDDRVLKIEFAVGESIGNRITIPVANRINRMPILNRVNNGSVAKNANRKPKPRSQWFVKKSDEVPSVDELDQELDGYMAEFEKKKNNMDVDEELTL